MSMISIWRQITSTSLQNSSTLSSSLVHHRVHSRLFSTSSPYLVKVGIPEFLRGIANGVEAHVEKLESEFGDLQKLLVARTLRLKKLEIPCKHRKLILKHAHKYRLGLWRPRADTVKV
ncbi:hypothetical protein RND81_12G163800 [Saponaria officinalis]|uniref:Small ribosomal subunit protein mS41 SAM domain-containing protein n=1 Tax=Saponaria officinalis TaxID=3572 RepID=A0AAW1HBF1_SAPOF